MVPICLATCARELGKASNRIYEVRFLRQLAQTLATKRRLMPERFAAVTSDGVRSIWEFDDRVTAPAFGFRDAADYYAQSSSRGFLGRIRVPALLVQAKDDPFIPFEIFQPPSFPANEHLRLRAVEHGGHVAFLAWGAPRFWAIHEAVEFFRRLL
jgi:predicted alpha/beta-fold hydrolase